MRKGHKKKKDVMKLKDHAMVKFWNEEESPLFNGENHEFIDSIYTRDPRLQKVRVRMLSFFDPVTTDCYNSYELSIVEPTEEIETPDPEWDPRYERQEQVTPSTEDPNQIRNDRINQDPIMGNLENA